MGGVATDVNGRTSVTGLWAAGEVASTGLHGANRLASNSLLEAVVVGDRVAADIKTRKRTVSNPVVMPLAADAPFAVDQDQRSDALLRLRATMSEHVGVIREAEGLAMALSVIGDIEAKAGRDIVLANMALTARLIASGALSRHESRGGHWRADYPFADPALAQRSFVRLGEGGRIEPLVTGQKSRRNPNPVLGAARV
jgi:L-aspartate oxidase